MGGNFCPKKLGQIYKDVCGDLRDYDKEKFYLQNKIEDLEEKNRQLVKESKEKEECVILNKREMDKMKKNYYLVHQQGVKTYGDMINKEIPLLDTKMESMESTC